MVSISTVELTFGGQDITNKIAQDLNVDFENAESLKISVSLGDQSITDQIKNSTTFEIENFIANVQETISFFIHSGELPPEITGLDNIFISGGGAKTIGLAPMLSSRMKVPVQPLNPFKRIDSKASGIDLNYLLDQGVYYSLGLWFGFKNLWRSCMSKLIKINLAPPEELENPLWFIPDVAAFIVVAMISYFIVDSSLEKIRDEIELANIQAQELSDQNVRLKSQIKRFDELNNIKENLTRKRDAVEKITSSSLDRYLPIIILEHIQNLKPEGIWLKNISFMKTEANNELAAVNTQSAGATNNNTGNFSEGPNYNV